MMGVAVVCSYGRRELCGLLWCWRRQRRFAPLIVWLDGVSPDVPIVDLPVGVWVHHAPRLGEARRIGAVRAAAVAFARDRFELRPHEPLILLDDDDYYSPDHVGATLAALEEAEWTGAQRIGIQWAPGAVPELVESSGGPGQHAAWGLRVRAYDAAGGYLAEDDAEDVQLAQRLGWHTCKPHRRLTHVRRQHGAMSLSSEGYDRQKLRAPALLADIITPIASPELERFEQWCEQHDEPQCP